ncbi:hypothetical protein [Acinetobacter bereziniae]|nr:hypothetical protein [Acinetobacter bereziniae]
MIYSVKRYFSYLLFSLLPYAWSFKQLQTWRKAIDFIDW